MPPARPFLPRSYDATATASAALRNEIAAEHGEPVEERDLLSAALLPDVYRAYRETRERCSDLSVLPTRAFLAPLGRGEEIQVEIERGKTLIVKLEAVGDLAADGTRQVFFQLNGQPRAIRVEDETARAETATRERADPADENQIGAPMSGVVVDVRAASGDTLETGGACIVLSAMKMETVVGAPRQGTIARVAVEKGDAVDAGDLLFVLEA